MDPEEAVTLYFDHSSMSKDGGRVNPNSIWETLVEDLGKTSGLSIGKLAKTFESTTKATTKLAKSFGDLEGTLWDDIFGTVISKGDVTLMIVGPAPEHHPSDWWVSALVLTGSPFAHDPGEMVNLKAAGLSDWKIEA
jgi:hypothetical protein